MTDIATTHAAPVALPDDLRFVAEMSQAAHVLAGSSMVPREYQGNPSNIVLAAGLGRGMGLDIFQSMQRITVIQGKPTAAAELIASNVRKAGHRLEVTVDEKAMTATATITRGDDGTVTTVSRDMGWAKRMGLDGKDNYKKQPTTMLSWRAISACARLACSEALYGVAYTPDEIADAVPSTVVRRSAADYDTPPAVEPPAPAAEVEDAEVVELDTEETGEALTDRTRREMFALFGEKGLDDPEVQRAGMANVLGRPVESRGDITEAEGLKVVASLRGER